MWWQEWSERRLWHHSSTVAYRTSLGGNDEDKRSWLERRCREIVRNERRENGADSKRGRGGVGGQEGNMSTRGDLGWWRREEIPARPILYTFQLE